MLELKGITKSYGKKKALDNISLSLSEGIYGLLGENGAGKTTLIHIMAGISEADSGNVFFDGSDIHKNRKAYNAVLGYMPQYASYYGDFTVMEFMKFMAAMKRIPRKYQTDIILDILQKVNLLDVKNKNIKALSGGMRQRLGIGQAILNDPAVLILDEPTAGLDPYERVQFRVLIREISKGKIIIFATHITQDVEQIADRIIMLHNGKEISADRIKLCKEGNLEQVFVSMFH